jgi:hypothetical protein
MTTTEAQQSLVEPHLAPGEHVVWVGQPDAHRMTLNYVVPGWGAALVLFIVLVIFGVPPLLLALFVFGMALITLAMGLLWIYPDARRTRYALTNRRILVLNARRSNVQEELGIDDVGPLQRFERKDGTGDLFFASEAYRRARRRGKSRHFGFIGIPHVRAVEQQVREVFPHVDAHEAPEDDATAQKSNQ